MSKKLLSPEAAHDLLVRRFKRQHQNWLAGEGSWPLLVALGVPGDKDIAEDASAVRQWADAWQSHTGPGAILFEERQFARFGSHRLPSRLSFESAAVVAAAIGQSRSWEIASERYQRMLSRWPVLAPGNALASKFDEGGDFHALVGLKKPAHRARIRLLCPKLRSLVGGLGDIEAPVAYLGRLPISPVAVVIVENLETGLAFPDVADTVLVMKLGNAVSALEALPWLRKAGVLYWGDIDTHGFAILARARKAVPQIRSVLMDEATLLAHQPLWVQEPVLCSNLPFEGLTEDEKSAYDHLRAGTWGAHIRLEQERLDWNSSLQTLIDVLNSSRIFK